jgi:hypothetical protein
MSAPNKPHPVTGLPFVFDRPKRARGERLRCFWHVQPTGDYFDECAIGGRFAAAYLRLIAEDDGDGGFLMSIVSDMCAALAQRGHSGIELGFLRIIEVGAAFGWRHAEETALAGEHSWRMYGKGALVNQRPDGSVVIEQPDGSRWVYRKEGAA